MTNSAKDMADHILKRFDDELTKLNGRISKMSDLVQQQVDSAVTALRDNDPDLAAEVIEQDDKVDLYDIKIEKLCLRLLALQQPVALDLRMVLSALSVNRHLERIGDCAVNIAERVSALTAHTSLVGKTHIVDMSEAAAAMIRDALKAFLESDPTAARAVAMRDGIVDEYDRQNFEILTGLMASDSSCIEAASHLLMVSRNIERIADEATNIAEAAVFVADAKIVKHGGWGMHFAEELSSDQEDVKGQEEED